MRFVSLARLAGLSLLLLAMTGCCSLCGDHSGGGTVKPDDPWLPKGLVRIKRGNNPISAETVGYVNTSPMDDSVRWWLMREGQSPPVQAVPGDVYTFEYLDPTLDDMATFCGRAGSFPMDPGEGPPRLFEIRTDIVEINCGGGPP